MPEQHRHLANECEDIVNLQKAEIIVSAARLQLVDIELLRSMTHLLCYLLDVQRPNSVS